MLTNNYNAEYGQATGLVMNVVTKSGTNGVHGEGHMYFRGRNLAASNAFYNHVLVGERPAPLGAFGYKSSLPRLGLYRAVSLTSLAGCDRAPFHRKEGGFTVGGPFKKDELLLVHQL